MNLSEFKVIFWWEWSHRFIARIIGILYLIPLVYFTYILGFKKIKFIFHILSNMFSRIYWLVYGI